MQPEEQAGRLLRAEEVGAGQKAPSSKGTEHTVGHREKLRQKTGDTWTGRSSDGYRNNYSERGNAGNEKRGSMKEPVTRGRKGLPGPEAERVEGCLLYTSPSPRDS